MPSRPYYKWYPNDFLADTRLLSLEEQGAYRALLDYLWISGPFEASEHNLARIWAVDRRKVRRIWAVLRPYFGETSGLTFHTKISKQRAEVEEIAEKRANSGRAGGVANATKRTRARAEPEPEPDLYTGGGSCDFNSGGNVQPLRTAPPRRRKSGRPSTYAEAIDGLADWAQRHGCLADDEGPVR